MLHYQALYRFAFCLARSPTDAETLTQAAFRLWTTRRDLASGDGDPEKAKTWLFTALHRHFVETRRSHVRFPHFVLADLDAGLPADAAPPRSGPGAASILRVLSTLDEIFQAPLALFFLENFSFGEIAEILETSVNTVRSRVARGKARLHERLTVGTTASVASSPSTRPGAAR